MLDVLEMAGTYEARKVGRFDKDGLMVSTARVTDGAKPYETAIRHPGYNGGSIIVVEAYYSKADAITGHAKWEQVMTADKLPDELVDCANSEIMQAVRDSGGKLVFKKEVL